MEINQEKGDDKFPNGVDHASVNSLWFHIAKDKAKNANSEHAESLLVTCSQSVPTWKNYGGVAQSPWNLMDNIHVVLAAPPHLKNTLRKLMISFFSMQPKAIKSLGGFESLEHLDIHDMFVSSIGAGRYSPYHGNIDEEALPYDVVMLELVKAEFENSTRLDLGYSDGESQGYLFD